MTITLKRDDILKVQDIRVEKVHVPEWGGDVYIMGLSGNARDEWEDFIIKARSGSLRGTRAKLCSLSICDENGKLLFSQKDMEALGEKSSSALQRIFNLAQEMSKIEVDAVRDLAEGLQENPTGDLPSD